jgi:inositol oxygenase
MPAAVHNGHDLDATSDAVDHGPCLLSALIFHPSTDHAVNVLKGKLWNARSEFDQGKDKSRFREYQSACERVKAFYKEQHGLSGNVCCGGALG